MTPVDLLVDYYVAVDDGYVFTVFNEDVEVPLSAIVTSDVLKEI